jgi:hypothetical protein
MHNRFDDDSGDSGISFRDVMLGIVGLLAAIVIILILQPKEPDKAAEDAERARGNIRVEVMWPDNMNIDIDTWGKAPNLPAVGYSNRNGVVLNLVRDDLGNYADISNRNYEVMFSRGLPQGEWVFNIHWFSNASRVISVPVTVLITITKDDTSGAKDKPQQVVATTLTLRNVGQEITVIRFTLDEDGDLLTDSMTSLFKPIRSMQADRGL